MKRNQKGKEKGEKEKEPQLSFLFHKFICTPNPSIGLGRGDTDW
jgi:hypothetical protein